MLLTAAQRQRKLNDPGYYSVFEESKAQAVAQLRTKSALDGIVELVRTCTATNPYLARVVVRELRQLVRDTVKNLTTRYEAGELVRLYDPEPRLRQGPAPPQRRLPNTPARTASRNRALSGVASRALCNNSHVSYNLPAGSRSSLSHFGWHLLCKAQRR